MVDVSPLPEVLLRLVIDRSIAVQRYLEEFTESKLGSNVALGLVNSARESAFKLEDFATSLLNRKEALTGNQLHLWNREAENTGKLYNDFLGFLESQLIPLFHQLELSATPPEVVSSIRRLSRRLLPDSEILVVSIRELNYKFGNIGPALYDVFLSVDCADLLGSNNIPGTLWLMQLCAMPPNGILTHTLLSHELGHGVYQTQQLQSELARFLSIDEVRIKQLANEAGKVQVPNLDNEQSTPSGVSQRRLGEYIHPSLVEFQIKSRLLLSVNR